LEYPPSQGENGLVAKEIFQTSVADPDRNPNPDPHVFGPSGSIRQRYGSGSFFHHAKILRKTYYFVTHFDFLSLKNDVNVPSKVISRKFFCSFLLAS
jgi:hypothetical protein